LWQEVRYRLYDIDETLRWTAIEVVARMIKRWWEAGKQEKVRNYIRTLFWSMSDESGGIGWSAPQTVAEIIALIPEIVDPYGSMMIAYSIEEPPLMKGGVWGIGRLGMLVSDSVQFFEDKILSVFQCDDPEILGLICWALGETGFKPAMPFIEKMKTRTEMVKIFIHGDFCEKSLGDWASDSVRKIGALL
jgi:hypothetical protein